MTATMAVIADQMTKEITLDSSIDSSYAFRYYNISL